MTDHISSQASAPKLLLLHSCLPSTHYADDILIRDHVPQPYSLRNMFSTCSPHQCILESLLQRPMDLITHVLDRRVVADDERLVKVGLDSLSTGISAT